MIGIDIKRLFLVTGCANQCLTDAVPLVLPGVLLLEDFPRNAVLLQVLFWNQRASEEPWLILDVGWATQLAELGAGPLFGSGPLWNLGRDALLVPNPACHGWLNVKIAVSRHLWTELSQTLCLCLHFFCFLNWSLVDLQYRVSFRCTYGDSVIYVCVCVCVCVCVWWWWCWWFSC